MIDFIIRDRFDFLDFIIFYFLWTEVVPWLTKKWKEWRAFAWKCPYCPKRTAFRISTNEKKTTHKVAEDHLMSFHLAELAERKRNEPVTDQ